ncbi:male sterility protein-domain-containing protein [Polychytrium aggregatum]|uniref:male sterility protein-domain-containing protein n=1 Tax=Polychytrium aggregatum TaxID=110093 RepID=UPI0022FF26A1|nr:male sterility protein-domain-containing protein [Polychytrium aggregatum]KAI9204128.1 male sterility protein-domain-containing protein [Polychytrium aggregatum]
MDPLGPWLHPIEFLVNTARDEPNALLINTYESWRVRFDYSYLDVWKRACSIAQGLKTLPDWNQVDPEVIGIYCEAEANWVFCSLAVWILGKKTLCFGLNLPPAARKALCERHSIKYILHHHTKPGRTEGAILIDAATFPVLSDAPAPSLESCVQLDEFVTYACTSGTTGVPKSFKYSHKAVTVVRAALGIAYIETGLCQLPSFVATLATFLATLSLKGSVWIPEPTPNTVDKAKSIIKMLDDGLKNIYLTPSFMKTVIGVALSVTSDARWEEAKKIGLGSELIPPSVLKMTRRAFPNAEIVSSYGSSETGILQAFCYTSLQPHDEVPEKLIYKLPHPQVRCLLFDEEGNAVDPGVSKSGILVFAVHKDHPVKNHFNFVTANTNDKIASFGFLDDGSPRVCTMDWVEMVSEKTFTVVGRFDQKIKVNGVYVDLNAIEELVYEHLGKQFKDCVFIQTSEKKVVMLYVRQKDAPLQQSSALVIQWVEDLLTVKNMSKFPIHNCFEVQEFPFNDSGKRDLKKLKHIAENVDQYSHAVEYPLVPRDDSIQSRIALKISQLGSEILDNPALDGRDYYIAGVGFDSLSVTRLALAIKDEIHVEISPMILFSNGMTPSDISHIALDIIHNKPFLPPTVDLAQEAAKLDDASVTADGLDPFIFREPRDVRGVVVTGATGFLGTFLKFNVANRFPNATIYCVIRADDEQHAHRRNFEKSSMFVIASRNNGNPWYDIEDRFVSICGDLSLDKWGLTDERWSDICEKSDVIIHCGAEVHWMFDYERLKGPNVLGTATALRLATTHHLKALHYISTIGTVPMAKNADEPLVEKIHSTWNIPGGYAQTKWVAEQLINKARSRGVPATIIRPAIIAGDSTFGVCNADDYLWRYVKTCIHIGIAPVHGSPITIAMDPVDRVAAIIAEIAGSEKALSKFVFHVSDPEHSVIGEKRLFDMVNAYGWPILFESREQFRNLLSAEPLLKTSVVFPLMHLMMSMAIKIDNTNTKSIYPAAPPPVELIVGKCLLNLHRCHYFPEPKHPAVELEDEYPEVSIFTRTGRTA